MDRTIVDGRSQLQQSQPLPNLLLSRFALGLDNFLHRNGPAIALLVALGEQQVFDNPTEQKLVVLNSAAFQIHSCERHQTAAEVATPDPDIVQAELIAVLLVVLSND